jgi:hypothetical protein
MTSTLAHAGHVARAALRLRGLRRALLVASLAILILSLVGMVAGNTRLFHVQRFWGYEVAPKPASMNPLDHVPSFVSRSVSASTFRWSLTLASNTYTSYAPTPQEAPILTQDQWRARWSSQPSWFTHASRPSAWPIDRDNNPAFALDSLTSWSLGPVWLRNSFRAGEFSRTLNVPWPLMVALALALAWPAFAAARRQHRQLLTTTLCPRCLYARGTIRPCPECGHT